MSDSVVAPFNAEQVESINGFQKSGAFHPFTCGICRADLIAREDGLYCEHDDYTQNWVHPHMADGSWKPHAEVITGAGRQDDQGSQDAGEAPPP